MRTLVAILALSPVLLHAQVKTPAQPVSTPVSAPVAALHSTSTLHASLSPASEPLAEETAISVSRRISTGVIPPRLVHSVRLQKSSGDDAFAALDRTVVIGMTVDAAGKPEDLRLVRAADPFTNREVLDAVAQFRYEPATVSGVAVASPVNLEVTVRGDQ